MKSGESLKEALKLYLANPIVVLPYFLFGLFTLVVSTFSLNFIVSSFAPFRISNSLQILLLRKEFTEALTAVLIKDMLFVVVIAVIYFFVDSFLKSYTIGLSEKISRTGTAKFSDGLSSAPRGLVIFGKNLALALLLLFGYALLFLTSIVLLANLALLAFIPAAIIYTFIVYSASFFSSQSIMIEKKGPWDGIVSSYAFIRRNMEDVAQLILFIIFVFVAFQVIELASMRLFSHFYKGLTLWVISKSEGLLLGYIIMRPYFVILKTMYFVKNQKLIQASSQKRKK